MTLEEAKLFGQLDFNLSEEQVNNPEFNTATLEGLIKLRDLAENNVYTKQQAQEDFEKIKGLDKFQVEGVIMGLDREEVKNQDFLTYRDQFLRTIGEADEEAFKEGRNDNAITSQIKAMVFGPEPDWNGIVDPRTTDYYETTQEIDKLAGKQDSLLKNRLMYYMVKDFTRAQIMGLIHHDLNPEQWRHPKFRESVLMGISEKSRALGEHSLSTRFDTIINLIDIQIMA